MYGRGAARINVLDHGTLNHQVTWQYKSGTTQDSFGQDVFTWTDIVTCKARVESALAAGRENQQVAQRWAEAEYVVTQNYCRGLEAAMRIAWLHDGVVKYLDVLSVADPVGTGRYQTAICRTFGSTFTA